MAGKRQLRALALALVPIVGFVGIRALDPFGIEKVIDSLALEIAARVIGAWYPYHICPGCAGAPLGRDKVSVALLGHEFPTLKAHDFGLMIDRLVALGARAIVFDLTWQSPQGPGRNDGFSQPMAEAINRAKAAGVPVVLGQFAEASSSILTCPDGHPIIDGRLAQSLRCVPSALGVINWMQSQELRARVYPLSIALSAPAKGQYFPTLSWAAYRLIRKDYAAGLVPPHDEDDMFLAWGRGRRTSSNSCGTLDPEAGRGLLEHAVAAVLSPLRFFMAPDPRTCPYIPEFLTSDLIEDTPSAAGLPVAGRTVFIGVDDPALDDHVRTPDGEDLPGVFAHATALDNLLTLGNSGRAIYLHGGEDGCDWWRAFALGVVPLALEGLIGGRMRGDAGGAEGGAAEADGGRAKTSARPLVRVALNVFLANRTFFPRNWRARCAAFISVAAAGFLIRILAWAAVGIVLLPLPDVISVIIAVFLLELTFIAFHSLLEEGAGREGAKPR